MKQGWDAGDEDKEEKSTEGGAESAVDLVAYTEGVGTLVLMDMAPVQGEMVVEEAVMDIKTEITTIGRIGKKEMGCTSTNRHSTQCRIVDTGQCS